jgi:hypothetical protein
LTTCDGDKETVFRLKRPILPVPPNAVVSRHGALASVVVAEPASGDVSGLETSVVTSVIEGVVPRAVELPQTKEGSSRSVDTDPPPPWISIVTKERHGTPGLAAMGNILSSGGRS